MKKVKITTAEFVLDNGVHIVWHKESSGWTVTKYLHGTQGKSIHALHLPTIENANHFNKTL
jgi:putative transposon-encoded protein